MTAVAGYVTLTLVARRTAVESQMNHRVVTNALRIDRYTTLDRVLIVCSSSSVGYHKLFIYDLNSEDAAGLRCLRDKAMQETDQ